MKSSSWPRPSDDANYTSNPFCLSAVVAAERWCFFLFFPSELLIAPDYPDDKRQRSREDVCVRGRRRRLTGGGQVGQLLNNRNYAFFLLS